MELILGTATFGSNYGIANQFNIFTEAESLEVLKCGARLGIAKIDTAPTYANAEEIIGRFHNTNNKYTVHSKISTPMVLDGPSIIESAFNSLRRLNVESLQVLYFHDPEMLISKSVTEIDSAMKHLLDLGIVEKWGVSVYTEDQIEPIIRKFPTIQVFQVPENVLDQRLKDSKYIQELFESGYDFYARSVFLQGLLLMHPEAVSANLRATKDSLESLHQFSEDQGLSPLQISISYIKHLKWAKGYLVGVTSIAQLQEIILANESSSTLNYFPQPLPSSLVDPRRWPAN